MAKKYATLVSWHLLPSDDANHPGGYDVVVEFSDGDRSRYSAGNHARESSTYVRPSHPSALHRDILTQYAMQTANMIATDHDAVPAFHDVDAERLAAACFAKILEA